MGDTHGANTLKKLCELHYFFRFFCSMGGERIRTVILLTQNNLGVRICRLNNGIESLQGDLLLSLFLF